MLVLIGAILLSLRAGAYETPIVELIKGMFGQASDPKLNIVVQNNRMPRIVTAIIAGAGLGISGCILQVILQNPLASASTLGVSQGASFGAAFAIIVLNLTDKKFSVLNLGIPFFAFVCSMGVALVIMYLSNYYKVTSSVIVLAGVALSSIFVGATTLMQYFADEVQLATLVYWSFGNLGSPGWKEISVMTVFLLIISVYFILHQWDYNALLGGSETAISIGINVERLTLVNMMLSCLLVSVVVSYVGLINFIGLVAPHMVRQVVGNNHVYLIPGSILSGATLLLLGDLLSRTVVSPIILPIGAITSFLGAPLFLYLLFKREGVMS